MKLSGLMFCLWISLTVFFIKAVTESKTHVILNMILENIFTEEKVYLMKKVDKDIIKNAVHMAWPAIIESFFFAFAGLVDSLMVSSLGASAVAAVGLTTQPKFIGLAVFLALNVAISALIARRRGEQRQEAANGVLCTALLFIIMVSILLSLIFVTLADEIIHLCGSAVSTHNPAVVYYRIIMGGMIFNCIQMGINAAQRGAGNTKITMRTNVTSSIVNVVFNYLLIGGHFGFPALGIHGAALATVLGSVVGCIMSISSLRNKEGFISIVYIIKHKVRPSFEAFLSLVKIGYSVFFEQLLMRIGLMATALMAARQGTDAMAAHQVGMNIMALTFSCGDGLQAAAVALIGRSLGEKNKELAKEYGKACRILGWSLSCVLVMVYLLGAETLMRLFFEEEQIVRIGVRIMRIIMCIAIFQILQVIYMGCLRGAGDTFYTASVSAVSVTVIRTFVSYFCGYVLHLGIVGIWMGILSDQMFRYFLASMRFRAGKWTQIKI